jgi:DNA-binding GntR family transcriptional regulator
MSQQVIDNARNMPVVFYKFSVYGKAQNTKDKKSTAEITEQKNADTGVGTVLVNRVPKQFSGPIKTMEGKIRNLFYKKAIQLGDSFAVPIEVLPAFKVELEQYVQEYKLFHAKLIEASENGELTRVISEQKGDFEIAIPSTDDIRNGYGVDYKVDCNFNSKAVQNAMKVLSDELKTQLREEVEISAKSENAEALSAVSKNIVETIREFLNDITEKCDTKETKGTHFKGLVDRMSHIVKVLPYYNVTKDPTMSKLIETVNEKFGKMNKEILKDDETARKELATGAKDMMKDFANIF